ncbi:hypothetical protein XBI1_2980014 [Xenorhabdus bovienii str. Intermedium]|uniref:Uncharacterized protein n=1 Tax=Xenorhabdus bovienii str. Intermedium TaxID=1379677 RepID=A0A077QKW8_XENBV|nr:hypothetical protein XBI1_2980014 [Xenorhabdus bovienii str. Intermedium]
MKYIVNIPFTPLSRETQCGYIVIISGYGDIFSDLRVTGLMY